MNAYNMRFKDNNEFKKLKNISLTVLTTFGHNGLDWMHSLLDSHSELLIMPAFSFFRTVDRIKLHNKNINFDKKNSINQISELFANMFLKDNRNKTQRRNFISTKIKKAEFKKYLIFWLKNSDINDFKKDLFLGIHYAYVKIYKIDLKKKKILVHQEHVPWHAEKYLDLFNPKFIFMMRDPRAAIAGSILRMQKHNSDIIYANQFDHVLLYWKYSTYFTCYKKNMNPKNIIVIKNEKLHQNLRKEMKKISNWLGVKFSNTLLNQSFLGKKWYGESAYLQGKNQEDDLKKLPPKNYYYPKEIKKRWKSVIDSKITLMIEVIFRKVMNKYEYKCENKINFLNIVRGYFYCLTKFTNQKKYFINKFLIKIRNLIRRIIILFYPSLVYRIYKIL